MLDVADAAPDFHARFSARAKTYHYRFTNGPVAPPFGRQWTWHVPWTLDVPAMQDAARRLVGEHDFSAFQSVGTDVRSTVRSIDVSRLVERPADGTVGLPGPHPVPACDARQLVYEVRGTGFLRHMVRRSPARSSRSGADGCGRRTSARCSRGPTGGRKGATAPACGLCLAAVHYADASGDRAGE